MIVVHVQHFLNDEGRTHFPDWIARVEATLQRFTGFRSIRQLTPIDEPEACHLLLEFETLELLRIWSTSPEHDQHIEELIPYRLRKQQSTIFEAK